MASHLKAIVCPQCGSTDQRPLKPGHYQCARCQTEYFIDDDNVTVTHLHQWVTPAAPTVPVRRILLGVGVFVALAVGIPVVIATLAPEPKSATTVAPPAAPTPDPNVFSWSSTESVPLVPRGRPGAAPVVVLVGQREYPAADDPRNGLYLTIYDPLTGAETRSQRLGIAATAATRRMPFTNVDVRVFSDGTLYVLANKTYLYTIDPATLTATDQTTRLFARQPALAAGIASMQFDQERWGDGLELLGNDGGKFHYYPLVDTLYADDDAWYRATHALTPPLPTARPRTYYTFTSQSFEHREEPRQLLKIRYLANLGGPEYRLENPSWHDNYGGSGFFTDRDPHVKELIGADDRRTSRILDFTDLTPGRRYFDPEVRFADSAAVLITLRATAAPDAPLRLQCLNPATGAIRWTTPLGDDDKVERFTRFAGGFVAADGARCTAYGPDGKVQRSTELRYQPRNAELQLRRAPE